jgi:hypothetical protein
LGSVSGLSLRAARLRSTFEDIGYQIHRIADVDFSLAIGVSGLKRIGSWAEFEDMIDQEDSITDVALHIAIVVAALILGSRHQHIENN